LRSSPRAVCRQPEFVEFRVGRPPIVHKQLKKENDYDDRIMSHSIPDPLSIGARSRHDRSARSRPHDHLLRCLARHARGDWGTVCGEDAASNNQALKAELRILSAYPIDASKPCRGFGENTLWIITEADRSATTFLLPDEY